METDIFFWYFDKLVRGGLNHLRHILITCQAAHGALENVSTLKSFGQVCCLNSAFVCRKKKLSDVMLVSGKVDTYLRSPYGAKMKVEAKMGAVSRKWHIHLLNTLWGV